MKIAIIGSGYVGLTTGACFADVGHEVICVDNDAKKIKMLREGQIPIYEPGLEEIVKKNLARGFLHFTESIAEGVEKSLVIFIAVPTPPLEDGSVDMTYIERVARQIAAVLKEYRVIVDKSTVPVKTGEKVYQTIKRYNSHNIDFDVVSNPEFLREGVAVHDLLHPDRVVIGATSDRAINIMKELYSPFKAPILITDLNSAELIKHASNSFLALKISYINALSRICEAAGANVQMVAEGMGLDHRIGKHFLRAGIGWGGSCFPKDVAAFIKISQELGYDFKLLKEVSQINVDQKEHFLRKIKNVLWVLKEKRIGLLGLAFKNNTDDIRSSVAMDLATAFLKEGAIVQAFDPRAMEKAKEKLPSIHYCSSAQEVARDSDCIVIATEWEEFINLDWKSMKSAMISPIIFDGRNLLDKKKMINMGFHYIGIGN
ncbi:UDP-glucose dehydrogenase family protein [Methylacidiphilum caldifontis]|uniref:UDP-glucose 6-dehydrogenase n=1 Tax=Methylacidiphilum caldifontis TaxID=2795386 RepID=A0A4Y8PDH2_9BACT|nr:UDP-glucose/GDP-mannose dehydrogenase family protein [Methylacidiphilum caldifontis]QSR88041.1 UDP-glucose/GDP-mannose dehydrogenase family protein [Methylacidiphilum caldifontis]TFE69577.1 UDP-glucose 6-dehydrogenase [Methylacidiphilum caldifontis]